MSVPKISTLGLQEVKIFNGGRIFIACCIFLKIKICPCMKTIRLIGDSFHGNLKDHLVANWDTQGLLIARNPLEDI